MRLNITPAPCSNGCRNSAVTSTFQFDGHRRTGLLLQEYCQVCDSVVVPPVAFVFDSWAWNVPLSSCEIGATKNWLPGFTLIGVSFFSQKTLAPNCASKAARAASVPKRGLVSTRAGS